MKKKTAHQTEEIYKPYDQTSDTDDIPIIKSQEEDSIDEESAIDNLQKEYEQYKEEQKDKFLRLAAEYDNYRKRTAREKSEFEPMIIGKIVTEFLPVLDNLERALLCETSDEKYKAGVIMIYDSFKSALSSLGVEEVPNEKFDPAFHQAVAQLPADEEKFPGKSTGDISEIFQKGYCINDKVLRFAMVTVIK